VAGVYSFERLHYGAFPTKNTNMKTIRITTLIAAALLTAGTALAQGSPNRCGAGYGGPPQTDEERAARQEACQQANGGACENGGACAGQGQGQGQGKGQGKGQGQGQGRGPRDGSGPRGGGAECPAGN
jgi:hypothetical protein